MYVSVQLAWNEEHQGENDVKSNGKPGIEESHQHGNGMKDRIQDTF
jgi:hypothetical protein